MGDENTKKIIASIETAIAVLEERDKQKWGAHDKYADAFRKEIIYEIREIKKEIKGFPCGDHKRQLIGIWALAVIFISSFAFLIKLHLTNLM